MFFINGALMATWISRIPQIQDKLGLSEGQLGIVLLGLSAGVLTALSVAGGLVARYGSRRVTVTAAFVLALLLISLPWMPNSVALWLNLFVFGMALSTPRRKSRSEGKKSPLTWRILNVVEESEPETNVR